MKRRAISALWTAHEIKESLRVLKSVRGSPVTQWDGDQDAQCLFVSPQLLEFFKSKEQICPQIIIIHIFLCFLNVFS